MNAHQPLKFSWKVICLNLSKAQIEMTREMEAEVVSHWKEGEEKRVAMSRVLAVVERVPAGLPEQQETVL